MIRFTFTLSIALAAATTVSAQPVLIFDDEVGNHTWHGSASYFVPPEFCFAFNNWNTGIYSCGPANLPTPATDVVIGQFILVDGFADCHNLLCTSTFRNNLGINASGTATYQGPVNGWGYFGGTGHHVFQGLITPDVTNQEIYFYGPATALISGGLTIAAGAHVGVYAVVSSDSTVTWHGNDVFRVDGAYHPAPSGRFKNLPQGLFLATGDGEMRGLIGLGYFDNEGTFRKDGGPGVTQVEAAFTNAPSGVIDVRTGTLRLGQSQANEFNGTAQIELGAVLEVAAILNVTSAFSSSGLGELMMTGGGFDIAAGATASVPILRMDNAHMYGLGTLRLTGVALLDGRLGPGDVQIVHGATATVGSSLAIESAPGTLHNHGRLLLHGAVAIPEDAQVINETDGVIEASGGAVTGYGFTAGTFANRGLFRQVGPADSSLHGKSVNDGGVISVEAGRLGVNNVRQTAGVTVLAGGALENQDAPTAMVMEGGRLTGSGQFRGHLINTGGSLEPGTSPGTIAFDAGQYQNSYTQGPGGSMVIEIGGSVPGTEHDQVLVNGTAFLGGTLRVTILNNFEPGIGQEFAVVVATGVAGQFATLDLPAGLEVQYTPTRVLVVKSTTAACNPGDIVSVGQLPPPDGQLSADDFLAFFGAYFGGAPLADIVAVGGLPPPDGAVSADDFLGFLNFYFQGC